MTDNQNPLKFAFLIVMVGVTFFSRSYYRHDTAPAPRTDITHAAAAVVLTRVSDNSAPDTLVVAPSPINPETVQAPPTASSPATTPAAAPILEAPSVPDPSSAFYRTRFNSVPDITAQAALVADVRTGEVYFEKHARVHWPTASLAKLMTGAVALDLIKPGNVFTVTDAAIQAGDNRLSNVFHSGDTFTVNDLMKALLISSSNEAAETLAISYGRDQFIAAMNERAASWGLNDTNFYDPAGISVANQSTAHDL
ncbi:MAG: serine hydrolase, partial [bacterium]|nr:serine hydrolase [bacterium]